MAARMRPRSLSAFIGQEHILAPGRLLWRAIQADQLSSLIFYGPPGTGKTTLAAVIANTTESHFETLNAVLAGISDIRRVTEEAKRRIAEHDRRTILFVDEVHRWNKAQQDALLPWVENGSVILIGATTENPYFTVNRALVSRSRIFQLQPLNEDDLTKVARMALTDEERGYGRLKAECAPEALNHIVNIANGDARAVLNALELAVETTEPDEYGSILITMEVAEESIQRRAVLYDKEGDYHFDTISAFIKSLRGSDPDASMYWLAKMVYAGEDPRFIFRRMLIFAAEDVGLAEPGAVGVVEAAAAAFDRVGLPEGQYHLGMTALYLATLPKSNSVFAYFDALSTIEKEREGEVPTHLKDGNRDKQGFGHGQGYSYPHAYREHWVAQQYLPPQLQGKLFYRPGRLGYEKELASTVAGRREAQLAAALSAEDDQTMAEILTWSPREQGLEAWLNRTSGRAGERLAQVRDRIFELAECRRHHRLLCVNDDAGLLVWEAIRQTPEGGVCAQVNSEAAAENIQARLADCPELRKPRIHTGNLSKLQSRLEAGTQFERIAGRNVIFKQPDKTEPLQELSHFLAESGKVVLAEPVTRYAPRLGKLLEFPAEESKLASIFREVEERIYQNPRDPLVNWDENHIAAWFEKAGFTRIKVKLETIRGERRFSPAHIDSWFADRDQRRDDRPGLGERLREKLVEAQVEKLQKTIKTNLAGRTVPWNTSYIFVTAEKNEKRPPRSKSKRPWFYLS